MQKCKCGGRPKKGAPPLSVLRMQDVAAPIFNFGGNPLDNPPSPPAFSAIYAEDTVSLCGRDPNRLYLEFPPYKGGVLANALKKLWTRSCECAPVQGLWKTKIIYKFSGEGPFGDPFESSQEVGSQYLGAIINVTSEYTTDGKNANWRWFGFTSADNYTNRVSLSSQSLVSRANTAISSTFSQSQLTEGCYGGQSPEPPPPANDLPLPFPITPPVPIIPPVAFIPEIPKKRTPIIPFIPEEDDCC